MEAECSPANRGLCPDYFFPIISVNATPDITHGTIWETIKAYIRGQIISYTSFEKNKQRRSMADLTARISVIKSIYK